MSIDASDLQRAVMEGNCGIVKSLLAKDPQLALARDGDNRIPLHWATSFLNHEMVQMLLNPSKYANDKTAKPIVIDLDDFGDDSGWTPLHIAASAGDFEIFKLLATHDPQPDYNQQTSTGQTCLHYAVSKNHAPIVEFLLKDLHASATIKDQKRQLPLHRAAAIGSEKLVQMLVETGKSPLNMTDAFGLSALHHSLVEGHADVALQLVKYGANWQQKTSDGESAFDIAANDQVRSFFKRGLVAEGLLEEQ